MKAILFKNNKLYFSENHPLPLMAEGEAVIRVTCAGICSTDLEIVKGYMGFEGILGHEFVGIVEKSSNSNLIGERIVGEINVACGKCSLCRQGMQRHCATRSVLGIVNKDGAFAQYLTLPVENLHTIPHSISDEEALFVEPVAAAFEILEQVNINSTDNVCVIGDGRLGNLTAQVLATTGCRLLVEGKHEEKLALLKAREIKTRNIMHDNHNENKNFDIVIDCSGSASGLKRAMELIRPKGKVVLKTTVAGERDLDLNELVINEITLMGSRCGPFEPAIKALAEKKINVKPLISKVFPLHDGVEAFRYAAQKGIMKVLLHMQDS